MKNIPAGHFVVGNKLMATCTDCQKIVRMDGLFGGFHFCLSDEERGIATQPPEPNNPFDFLETLFK